MLPSAVKHWRASHETLFTTLRLPAWHGSNARGTHTHAQVGWHFSLHGAQSIARNACKTVLGTAIGRPLKARWNECAQHERGGTNNFNASKSSHVRWFYPRRWTLSLPKIVSKFARRLSTVTKAQTGDAFIFERRSSNEIKKNAMNGFTKGFYSSKITENVAIASQASLNATNNERNEWKKTFMRVSSL